MSHMIRKVFISLPLLVLLFQAPSLFAQRTSKNTQYISASASWTLSSFGGELDYGMYLHNSHVFGGLNIGNRAELDVPTNEIVNHQSLELLGGWEWRLYGSRSRMVNVYIGGDAFIGAEALDVFKTARETTRQSYYLSGFKDYKFIFGISPRAELEFFVSRSVALTAGVRAPVTFLSQYGYINLDVLLGARFNL